MVFWYHDWICYFMQNLKNYELREHHDKFALSLHVCIHRYPSVLPGYKGMLLKPLVMHTVKDV